MVKCNISAVSKAQFYFIFLDFFVVSMAINGVKMTKNLLNAIDIAHCDLKTTLGGNLPFSQQKSLLTAERNSANDSRVPLKRYDPETS